MVHLTVEALGIERHFCEECADENFARTPGMNSARRLICLSDSYRAKLYGLLEKQHPEAFDNSTTEACQRGGELMRAFLGQQLASDKVELNQEAFDMLCADFFGSRHFYDRAEDYRKKKG